MAESLPTSQFPVDPVCGMAVDPASPAATFRYEGTTYYFCAEECRKAFEAAPATYLKRAGKKPTGIWQRYLHRLNKATGGRPPSCCH